MKRSPQSSLSPSGSRFAYGCFALALAVGVCVSTAEEKKDSPPKKAKAVALSEPPAGPDGSVVLRNLEGQEIRALLLTAHGESVKIKRAEDGREFTIALATLDEYSTARIRSWIDSSPDAVEYSVAITASRNLVNSTDFVTAGREFKTADWAYRITVTNQTRSSLDGAMAEYRIIYDDHVDFVRTAVGPGKGRNQQDGQAVDLPEMHFNDQIEFTTPPVQLQTYKYSPLRGEKEYVKDTIKGLWVRITKNGQTLAEYQSNPASMASLTWDNESDTEIRVTNRFRDNFTSEAKE